jgi:broad specificity phosphatase PhoE
MLVLVRHGRTEANASGLLLGRADPGLDEAGREQAEVLRDALEGITRIVTSPLRRCVETARAIGVDVEPEVDERWIELDYGTLDQQAWRDVGPEVWRQWRADPHFVPGGGESLADLHTRVAAACEALADEARTGNVAVVSHVSPIKAAVAWALGVGVEISWRMHLDVAAISRVLVGDRGPVLLSFNEVRHLAR